ncbi:Uncharacterised protein [Mycobacterium tuberculosis]|uniref:Uncharacterized protein n=1 Tax=Mycobacterium tuberculosis TaxID=1773 RepID=A0A655FXN5_MYCTX|nr:Uncharacterised protein [Mycobacterium tuberculosis]CNW61606.1 Uncharacterised protein [Mycobacterium tuberculosis]COZ91215.1 Uncharacterised protein [Mycobacterium tuberculosis]SGO01037.1 Uncharacterised protein [Mycobacterium tuberculosis]
MAIVEVRSSAWVNRNGPPVELDCHRFDDAAVCLWSGRIRYCGSSAMPRCSENGRWQGKLAAVAMSINTGVADPINRCRDSSTGTRGGVKANHCSGLRFGS